MATQKPTRPNGTPLRQPRPRTRDQTMTGDAGVQVEVKRSLRTAFRDQRARTIVAAAMRRGDILPRPGSPEWLEIIKFGIDAGLLRKPK